MGDESQARPPRSFWRGIGRALAVTLVFVAVGPPIGAITFFISVALIGMGRNVDLAGLGWIGLFALIYGVPMSYLIGSLTAAGTGAILGLGRAFLGWASWTPAVLTGLGIGILVSTTAMHVDLTFVGVCLIPTLACWWLARRLVSAGPSYPSGSRV